ncbi:MAG: L-seryl-tRNA(Sec) selenium transferase, partial [Eggerthellaceae bacterium]|nr:L-seryl-tRNA(Sec) selenium transferase [Eggerthellaceae bacterium]
PAVVESLNAGADLVSFSGDTLLGGPQAGIIVGRADLIARLKANPLARAMRLDTMTLAALEATLRLSLDSETALDHIPTVRMLIEDADSVKKRADALKAAVEKTVPADCAELAVVSETSRAGGGALPMCDIATYALEVRFKKGTAQACEEHLVKDCPQPIIARISQETVLCDARTILDDGEIASIAEGFASYFASL